MKKLLYIAVVVAFLATGITSAYADDLPSKGSRASAPEVRVAVNFTSPYVKSGWTKIKITIFATGASTRFTKLDLYYGFDYRMTRVRAPIREIPDDAKYADPKKDGDHFAMWLPIFGKNALRRAQTFDIEVYVPKLDDERLVRFGMIDPNNPPSAFCLQARVDHINPYYKADSYTNRSLRRCAPIEG